MLVALVALGLGASGCSTDSDATSKQISSPSGLIASAKTHLAQVEVKGRAPKTGYARDRFGPAWADVDTNGCDTRNDILRRDLANVTFKPGTRNCVVATGTLADPYTGATIAFVRGPESDKVQIDHVVALSNAWQTGAFAWDDATRLRYANDPQVLLAVDGPANNAKGDADAATWLPANRGEWCDYVARQTEIKYGYKLWMTPAEHDRIAAILATC